MNYISRSFGGELLLLLLNRSHKMPPFLREDLSFLKMTFFHLKEGERYLCIFTCSKGSLKIFANWETKQRFVLFQRAPSLLVPNAHLLAGGITK